MSVRTVKDFLDLLRPVNPISFKREGVRGDIARERMNLIENGFGLW